MKEPLVPKETRRLDLLPGSPLREWFDQGGSPLAPNLPVVPAGRNLSAENIQDRSFHRLTKQLLFYHLSRGQGFEQDASTRGLDQSWRLERQPVSGLEGDYRDEAVLVARTPIVSDRAEAVLDSKHSPSRLWLGELPGAEGATRPPVRGFLTQESYVRVYIPVRARAEAKRPGDEGKP
jgi:hypothetical protein